MVVPYLSGSAFTNKKPKRLLAVVYSPDDFSRFANALNCLTKIHRNPLGAFGSGWLVGILRLQSVLGHHLFGVEFRKNSRYA